MPIHRPPTPKPSSLRREGWADAPCIVLATGPSLTDAVVDEVRAAVWSHRVNTIAVNNAGGLWDWPDVAYFGDYLFGKVHQAWLQKRAGTVWTIDRAAAERWGYNLAPAAHKAGLGADRVHSNGNSGAQAVNLAVLFGARRILLVGFDMREVDGRAHYFGQHQAPLTTRQLFGEWVAKFRVIAEDAKALGIEIINCTPGSAIDCLPVMSLRDALSASRSEP